MISTLQLARLCGVSQGTVDRALHRRSGIREETRRRVLRAAEAHGHRPHPAAREMITGTSGVVQAILPALNNIFFMDCAHRLGEALEPRGLRLQISLVTTPKSLLDTLNDAAARRCRMAILVPPEDGIVIPRALTRALPMVALFSPFRGGNVPFLSPNEETTGVAGVEYLVSRGHRKILYLTSRRRAHAVAARLRGYRRAMAKRKLPSSVVQGFEPAKLAAAIRRGKPTALFCHNDWLAVEAILALRAHGLEVPGDLSVLGIDHSPTIASLAPQLTTLAYPIDALVRGLVGLCDGKKASLVREPFSVVERGTVASVA